MRKKNYKKIAFSVAGVLSFVICGFLYSCADSGSTVYTVEQGLEDTSPESVAEESSSISSSELTSQTSFVYVCGNVNNPGVYEVPADSRIYEVIDMAGGPNETGCLEALNLADHVDDGQKIYVPDFEEYEAGYSGTMALGQQTSSTGVNINVADKETLMTLPGIGETRAQAIIDYRNSNGRFENIEDIMNVSGIKESAFLKIKDLICTE